MVSPNLHLCFIERFLNGDLRTIIFKVLFHFLDRTVIIDDIKYLDI
ncbi:hypothetical protein HNQ03_002918 [Chryseobacterium sp. 16F]|uniref:Uncharacterized protein n=1 Tax=Frigoriflavimonas asaccharolytica TaxID=2735899 RepID=A0A8J8KA60_9FLAO|nr:hypothetical protein [Frigoriflavimonas asaccharolytica]